MKHALIIGGTGMLRKVTEYLSEKFETVSGICRNKFRLDSNLKNINPLILDYSDYELLSKRIDEAVKQFGEIDLVVSWIHSTAPLAPKIIAEKINAYGKPFRFFDILGSAYADPSKNKIERENNFRGSSFLIYRKIILGFVIENKNSRWLTNNEISGGVIEAVKNDLEEKIIGRVSPWEMKP